ncbi:hypothetical protein HK405_005508, partial [Cladochytrium tenue]
MLAYTSLDARFDIGAVAAAAAGDRGSSSYAAQYAGLYFARLATAKPRALASAARQWAAGDGLPRKPVKIERLLDVEPGVLCYGAGTVYMEQPLKPNVLDDIARE